MSQLMSRATVQPVRRDSHRPRVAERPLGNPEGRQMSSAPATPRRRRPSAAAHPPSPFGSQLKRQCAAVSDVEGPDQRAAAGVVVRSPVDHERTSSLATVFHGGCVVSYTGTGRIGSLGGRRRVGAATATGGARRGAPRPGSDLERAAGRGDGCPRAAPRPRRADARGRPTRAVAPGEPARDVEQLRFAQRRRRLRRRCAARTRERERADRHRQRGQTAPHTGPDHGRVLARAVVRRPDPPGHVLGRRRATHRQRHLQVGRGAIPAASRDARTRTAYTPGAAPALSVSRTAPAAGTLGATVASNVRPRTTSSSSPRR